MSGIEVVGLVLAAIPLIISGFEHYADMADRVRIFRGAAQEFRLVVMLLEAEKTEFENTLKMLLQDCVDLKTASLLLKNVGGEMWQNADVRDALKTRLQSSFTSYIDYVGLISRDLEGLLVALRIDNSGKGPFNDKRTFIESCRRFKFALKRGPYVKLIESIHGYNTHLLTLTEQCRVLDLGHLAREHPDFELVRSGASHVFDSLQQVLHNTCGYSHRASICLRPVETECVAKKRIEDVYKYRVILHHVEVARTQVSTWTVAETEIKTTRSLPDDEHVIACLRSTSNRKTTVGKRSVAAPQNHGIAVEAESSTPFAGNLYLHENVQISFPDRLYDREEILNLCEKLHHRFTSCTDPASINKLPHRYFDQHGCIGHVNLAQNAGRHQVSIPQKQLMRGQAARCVLYTLDALIERRQHRGFSMSNADARRLAVSLSLGMLRLHGTPWLRHRWDKTDVSLIQDNAKILASYPFLSRGLDTEDSEAVKQNEGGYRSPIRNQTLFSLGIMLIELCMRMSIVMLHTTDELDEYGQPREHSSIWTATRLLSNGVISEVSGKKYSDVVYRCIHCAFSNSDPSLSNRTFRVAVYNEIIQELVEDCQYFTGEKIQVEYN